MYLNNTNNPSFNWMELSNFENSAIVGRNVAGFLNCADSGSAVSLGTTTASGKGQWFSALPVSAANPTGVNGLTGAAMIRNAIIAGGVRA